MNGAPMCLRNTIFTYGIIAKFFHWVMAIAIIGMLTAGFIMIDMPMGPDKIELYGIHKAVGALILIAAGLRFLWRQSGIVPALPGEMSSLERFAVHSSHFTLYFLMFFMPAVGWGMSSAAGYPVSVFGWFTLPDFIAKSKPWYEIFRELHYYGAYVFIALISLHVLAGFYHHFVRGDNIFRRMLPW